MKHREKNVAFLKEEKYFLHLGELFSTIWKLLPSFVDQIKGLGEPLFLENIFHQQYEYNFKYSNDFQIKPYHFSGGKIKSSHVTNIYI